MNNIMHWTYEHYQELQDEHNSISNKHAHKRTPLHHTVVSDMSFLKSCRQRTTTDEVGRGEEHLTEIFTK